MNEEFSNRLLKNFLRFFFHLLYNQFSFLYDLVAAIVSIGMWRQWIMAVLPYIKGERVLEIGHGPGHLQIAMQREGFHPVGIDASWQMARRAYRNIKRSKLENPAIVNGYAQHLPFHNAFFSTVLATFPAEFISSHISLSEIFRVLEPDGQFIILPFAWITGQALPHRLASWLFSATRQTPSNLDKILQPFYLTPLHNAGFVTYTQIVEFENSSVLLLIASKPGYNSNDGNSIRSL